MPEAIGRRITGLREQRDMTLEELAAKIGVNATCLLYTSDAADD